jgi:hypothetical protein
MATISVAGQAFKEKKNVIKLKLSQNLVQKLNIIDKI